MKIIELLVSQDAITKAAAMLPPGSALGLGTIPAGAKFLRTEARGDQVALVFEVPGEPAPLDASVARVAPWTDFAGKPIHEGDLIRHPDGSVARVVFDPQREGVSRWRAVYESGESLWLGNQIGGKGMAEVDCRDLPAAESGATFLPAG